MFCSLTKSIKSQVLKKIVEEFVQNNASVSNIQNEIEKINFDSDYRQSLIKNISSIEKVLLNNSSKTNINLSVFPIFGH